MFLRNQAPQVPTEHYTMLLLSRHFQIFNRHIQNKQLSIIRVRISISANNTKTYTVSLIITVYRFFLFTKKDEKKIYTKSQTRHLRSEFIVAANCDRKSACNGIYRKSAHTQLRSDDNNERQIEVFAVSRFLDKCARATSIS